MKSVIILSGGLDSTTLLYRLIAEKKDVYAISFNYGQKHIREIKMANATCRALGIPHKVVNVKVLSAIFDSSSLVGGTEIPEGHYADETMKSTVVPNRNMIFASIAIGYAVNIDADEVALGVHAGDHAIYPDCRPLFIDKLCACALVANYKPIMVYAPYLNLTKGQIVQEGMVLKVDYSLTQTCYKGDKKPCGRCGSCVERAEAFALNNWKDPLCGK
jgi:7-cyano-7-deazaguanine synthase